jgi:hypothetical protein
MILCHLTERKFLPSIFANGLQPTGRVPLAVIAIDPPATRWMFGVVWLFQPDSDWWMQGLPGTEDQAMIRVRFPEKTLSRKLVKWEPSCCPDLPAFCFHPTADTYYFRGAVAPGQFFDVHDCAGNLITAADVASDPIISGQKKFARCGDVYVDHKGRDVTMDVTSPDIKQTLPAPPEPEDEDAWSSMWRSVGVA